MQRLMLTPGIRLMLRAGVPFVLSFGAATWWLSNPDTQAAIRATVAEARASIEQRPEFMVNLMAIDGADTKLSESIRTAVPLDFPISSFDLDPAAIRATVLEMPPVKEASVRIRPGGVLQVDITPRVPIAIWRRPEGLTLIDEAGALVRSVARRGLRPDLPVIAGEGAASHVDEAMKLIAAGAPLGDRMRGLVRLGDRRWDVVLDRNQRIMLPADGAVQALERVIALDGVDEVLKRDIARIDLRLEDRPTVRMTDNSTAEWRRIRQLTPGTE
ncbi:cell division protein FtsQ/DivIB [uncultured Tateyamaria sp.]|uniref:cell division protein FtsQ/DivIB n=1 Tax=uncultured Tateyamaria sp. TaxID=455651 RepID=UPI002630E37D|nr:cell division protein FtsQ/DivIB [uncultured Tateyamaria sp.]